VSLGLSYRRSHGAVQVHMGADLVGDPAIGPTVFMHRPSAAETPQAPLAHHHMDATHITHGVVRGGVEWTAFGVEGSVFRGREPDENRLDLDLGALDSWAVRGTWRSGPWTARAWGARLHEPETLEPGDVTRLGASVAFTRTDGRRELSALLAWGQNRELFGTFDAYLLEFTLRPAELHAVFGRLEVVDKNILGGGAHAPDAAHAHPASRVGAATFGYVRDFLRWRAGRVGIGADVTGYRVPSNLEFYYGSPASFHVFLRYRLPSAAGVAPHVH
jgi:hypothetical protein